MLEAVGLTKRYAGVTALDDVTFRLRPGCVTGLLGPNGSGKTTTLRLALGLERPTSGSVTIGGARIAELEYPYQRVGALLDASWIHPNRSARAQLRWIAQASRIARERVDWALEEVGLASVAEQRAGTFSLGMRQRLGLASTILGRPELLILDEPLNGLDPDGARWMRGFIKRRADDGCAVLLASHLLGEMEATAERVLVLGAGRLLFDGTLAELRDDAGAESFVEVECTDPHAAVRVLNAAPEATDPRARVVDDERGVAVVRVSGGDLGAVGASCRSAGIAVIRIERRSTSLREAYSGVLTTDREGERSAA